MIDDMSISSAPDLTFSRMPSGPYAMASTCGEAGTIVITTLASRTASAIEPAAVPPAAARRSSLSCSSVKPVTSYPALTRFSDMGEPMMPRPIHAIEGRVGWEESAGVLLIRVPL